MDFSNRNRNARPDSPNLQDRLYQPTLRGQERVFRPCDGSFEYPFKNDAV